MPAATVRAGCVAQGRGWRRFASGLWVWQSLPGGREDPGRDGLCVARPVGRGGDRDRRDQVPVRFGRVARRGDAGWGGGNG
ncbi:hypothetical protein I552_2277 [Mycobacterium xenopi 3993]|nr:hypothetical protein I552_2277 [Mycobacterium xenopi 3993]